LGLPETSGAGYIALADDKKDVKIFNIREKDKNPSTKISALNALRYE